MFPRAYRDRSERESPESMEKPQAVRLQRHPDLLIVLNTPKGRGVFATRPIPARTVVETCPVLVLSPEESPTVSRTTVDHYTFNWPYRDPETGKQKQTQALALGLGSMFNHSRDQNVGFQRDLASQTIIYTTLRGIKAQEELCISYGPNVWFEDVDKGEHEETEAESDILTSIDLP